MIKIYVLCWDSHAVLLPASVSYTQSISSPDKVLILWGCIYTLYWNSREVLTPHPPHTSHLQYHSDSNYRKSQVSYYSIRLKTNYVVTEYAIHFNVTLLQQCMWYIGPILLDLICWYGFSLGQTLLFLMRFQPSVRTFLLPMFYIITCIYGVYISELNKHEGFCSVYQKVWNLKQAAEPPPPKRKKLNPHQKAPNKQSTNYEFDNKNIEVSKVSLTSKTCMVLIRFHLQVHPLIGSMWCMAHCCDQSIRGVYSPWAPSRTLGISAHFFPLYFLLTLKDWSAFFVLPFSFTTQAWWWKGTC
jgi:hypothetical protein